MCNMLLQDIFPPFRCSSSVSNFFFNQKLKKQKKKSLERKIIKMESKLEKYILITIRIHTYPFVMILKMG